MAALSVVLILGGRFRLERPAGRGGHGEVWRALDLTRAQPVAVKVLSLEGAAAVDDEAARRLAAEAEILATLDHPGIVALVAHGRTPAGAPYLVEDWIDGPTLREVLTDPGLSAAAALDLFERLATIAGSAHRAGIVHRDLKPENVLLAEGRLDQPRLIDFGVSRLQGREALTRSGTVIGSVGYLAPEQVRAERHVDARADVFALGCMLYEALTGRPAFAGSGLLAVSAKVQFEEPRALDALCPEGAAVSPLLARVLAKSRDRRPADGTALAALLATAPRPVGPVRCAAADAVATLPVGQVVEQTSAVLALGALPLDGAARAVWTQVTAAWAGPGTLLAVEPGSLVVRFDRLAVDDALAIARRLRDGLRDASVVVITSPRGAGLDDGFALAERVNLADAFRPAGTLPPIRVDPATARLAPTRVRWERGEWRLIEA